MVMKVIARIKNIPPYTSWSEFKIGPENCENTPPTLSAQRGTSGVYRRAGRASTAAMLTEKYGYSDPDPVGADPEDHDKWFVTNHAVIDRLADIVGLRKPLARVQVSIAGQGTPLHIDHLGYGYINETARSEHGYMADITEEDRQAFQQNPSYAQRVIIFLDDWKQGQGFVWENGVFDRWKAGDVITWNWQHDFHATYNMGYWKRPLVRISGIDTQKFRKILIDKKPLEVDF
jgi:hypothetical protein